jgi:hypothetical protein
MTGRLVLPHSSGPGVAYRNRAIENAGRIVRWRPIGRRPALALERKEIIMTSKNRTKPRWRTTAAAVCILGAFAVSALAFTGSASASSCWYSLRGCVSVGSYYRNYPGYYNYRTPSYSYRYSYSYRTPGYSYYGYRTPSYSYSYRNSYSYSYRTPSYLGYGSSYGAR